MTPQTVTNFETHFHQFLADRKDGTKLKLLSGMLTIDKELDDMKTAASTLINDYGTIYADSDPVDRVALTRSAVGLMRTYFSELVEFAALKKPAHA